MVEDLEVNWNPTSTFHGRFVARPVQEKPVIPNAFKDLKLGVLSERWNFNENVLPIVEDLGKPGVRITGKAAMGNVVSKNNRKYLEEELTKAARTWIAKPITINHSPPKKTMLFYDGNKIVGHLGWMEYEDGLMKYSGVVTKEPYATLLRNKSTEIKSVSIEADFLTNECPQCGKFFGSDEAFYKHAEETHFNKNLTRVPRGIVGSALSLVLAPEIAGIEGTSVELRETVDGTHPFAQLAEALVSMKEGFAVHKSGQVLAGPNAVSIPDKKLAEYIEQRNGEFCVISHTTGKELGCFPTEEEAKTRLAQMKAHESLQTHADAKVREDYGLSLQWWLDVEAILKERAENVEKKSGLDKLTETVNEKNSLKETVSTQHKQILDMEVELCRRENLVVENEKQRILIENLRDKVKPVFKGQAKSQQVSGVDPGASNWTPDMAFKK